MCITETQTTNNSGQLLNTIVYNYEFIEDYCDDSNEDADDDSDAQPITPQLSSNSFSMTSYAQISNQISSDGLEWLIDPIDEGSFSTSTEQGTKKQEWRPKTFSFSSHPLTLMVRNVHCS